MRVTNNEKNNYFTIAWSDSTNVGVIYYNGLGVAFNFDRALYYYYGQGGIKKNDPMALELFTSIESETESKECCYMLGECYCLGRGVKKDNQQAANWCIKAGNVIAYERLLKMQRQDKIDIESM